MDESMRKLAMALSWLLANALLLLNVLAMTKILLGLDTVKIAVVLFLCQFFFGLVWGGVERAQRERRETQAELFALVGRHRGDHRSIVVDQDPLPRRDGAP